MNSRVPFLQILLGALALAAFAPPAVLCAEPPPPPVAPAEKPRLAPRPLPGTATAQDKQKAEEVPVVPFIPMPDPAPAADASEAAPRPVDMDRARILVVRRRGTFKVPPTAEPETAEPSAGEMTEAPVPTAIQEPLAEGKIRIVPRALVPPSITAPPTKP